MLFQEPFFARSSNLYIRRSTMISTQPESVNIQFLDRVRRTNIFLIFTYSTVTDPLPGDLIMEDIDLGQKMCQTKFPVFSQKLRQKSRFCLNFRLIP